MMSPAVAIWTMPPGFTQLAQCYDRFEIKFYNLVIKLNTLLLNN